MISLHVFIVIIHELPFTFILSDQTSSLDIISLYIINDFHLCHGYIIFANSILGMSIAKSSQIS